ncbi:MAG: PadR family transcriptional regulator [Candidatus Micrarchaeota archaeon]|nr:PadR family transcriptional regulator [Candidatus Micrarchaeota archaeon]
MHDYGCDMRGLLSFQILFLLSKRPMHGEEIAQEIKRRRGEKPKAGTIYPALKELSSKGLIHGRKEGKTVVYSITADGRESLRRAMRYFLRSFGDMLIGRSK